MAASKITDLDVLLATPRQVRLGGQVYKLPGDIPAELYLKIVRYAQADESDVDESDIRGVYEDVLDLFRVHHQDMDRLPAALSLPMMVELIGHVYMGAGDAGGPTKAKPKASKGGTTSGRSPKQSRSQPKR